MNLFIRTSLFIAIIILNILYFTTIAHLSGAGALMSDLRGELASLERQNSASLVAVTEQSRVSSLEAYAAERGLLPDAKLVYIQTPSSLVVSKK